MIYNHLVTELKFQRGNGSHLLNSLHETKINYSLAQSLLKHSQWLLPVLIVCVTKFVTYFQFFNCQ